MPVGYGLTTFGAMKKLCSAGSVCLVVGGELFGRAVVTLVNKVAEIRSETKQE